jgi:hypothetical protein
MKKKLNLTENSVLYWNLFRSAVSRIFLGGVYVSEVWGNEGPIAD